VLEVEVIYAVAGHAWRRTVELPEGASVGLAIERSGVLAAHPEIDLARDGAGMFGRRVPITQVLRPGDRVEILRPLQADPGSARRKRAVKARR
jgi:putative ubiquitin-RnfH superfamily antitoxin RatB of RatAB toxin-antitoxin module